MSSDNLIERAAKIAEGYRRFEASDFPVCNSIAYDIRALGTSEPGDLVAYGAILTEMVATLQATREAIMGRVPGSTINRIDDALRLAKSENPNDR